MHFSGKPQETAGETKKKKPSERVSEREREGMGGRDTHRMMNRSEERKEGRKRRKRMREEGEREEKERKTETRNE